MFCRLALIINTEGVLTMARQKMLEDTRLSKESMMTEAVTVTKSGRKQRDAVEPNPVKHTAAGQSDFMEDLHYILGF